MEEPDLLPILWIRGPENLPRPLFLCTNGQTLTTKAINRLCSFLPSAMLRLPKEWLLVRANSQQKLSLPSEVMHFPWLFEQWLQEKPEISCEKACIKALQRWIQYVDSVQSAASLSLTPAQWLHVLFMAFAHAEVSSRLPRPADNSAVHAHNWCKELVLAGKHLLQIWQKELHPTLGLSAFLSHVYGLLLPKFQSARQKKMGVWLTPEPIADFVSRTALQLLDSLSPENERLIKRPIEVLEPAAGLGIFIEKLIEKNRIKVDSEHESASKLYITAVEADEPSAELVNQLFCACNGEVGQQKIEVLHTDWLTDRRSVDAWAKRFRNRVGNPKLLIIGNPPWSGISANMGSWVEELVNEHRNQDSNIERKHWMHDDYVKFFVLAQYLFAQTHAEGVFAFVCSHSWLDNPTFRSLRESMMNRFQQLWLIDLHGSLRKKEAVPEGQADENVFENIRNGAAIVFAISSDTVSKNIHRAEIWGSREEKLHFLKEKCWADLDWKALKPTCPNWNFTPQTLRLQHSALPLSTSISDLFVSKGSCVVTARDAFVFADHPEILLKRIESLVDMKTKDEDLVTQWRLRDTSHFRLAACREILRAMSENELRACLQPIAYRPFCRKWIFYQDDLVERRGYKLMKHMLQENTALVTVRRSSVGDPAGYYLAAQNLVSQGFIRSDNQSIDYLFPLWRYDPPEGVYESTQTPEKVSNLNREVVLQIEQRYGMHVSPETIMGYIYALCYSRGYRACYAHELRSNFMQIAWVPESKLFLELAHKGNQLLNLHREGIETQDVLTADPGLKRHNFTGWPQQIQDLEPTLREQITSFQIGAYDVAKLWLRNHVLLEKTDPTAFETKLNQLIRLLSQTLDLMNELDELVPEAYWQKGK